MHRAGNLLRRIRWGANYGNIMIVAYLHMGIVQHVIGNADTPQLTQRAFRAGMKIDLPGIIVRRADHPAANALSQVGYDIAVHAVEHAAIHHAHLLNQRQRRLDRIQRVIVHFEVDIDQNIRIIAHIA